MGLAQARPNKEIFVGILVLECGEPMECSNYQARLWLISVPPKIHGCLQFQLAPIGTRSDPVGVLGRPRSMPSNSVTGRCCLAPEPPQDQAGSAALGQCYMDNPLASCAKCLGCSQIVCVARLRPATFVYMLNRCLLKDAEQADVGTSQLEGWCKWYLGCC